MNLLAKSNSILSGEVLCPGDKSISQRIVIIGSLINEDLSIKGFLNGEDPMSTAMSLNAIGSSINISGTDVEILKRDMPFISPENDIDLGNSGTGIRLLMGLISSLDINATLVGDESLSKRPMLRVANPLNEMGAKVACTNGTPPVKIEKGDIKDNFLYDMPVASAQVKSSIILSALAANKKVTVIEEHPTRNHTERMINYFGGNIESTKKDSGNIITLHESKLTSRSSYEVVGDFSSAAFLIVAGLIAKESNILIRNVGLNPTRCGLIKVLKSMGANIEILNQSMVCNEEVGDVSVQSSKLQGIDVGGDIIPNIIDEIPILSIAASFAEGITTIKDAEELRVKESDRLAAISGGLSQIGIKHELFDDGIKIQGTSNDIPVFAQIDSFGDHRIVMSFLVASLRSEKGMFVKNCKNIFTSFPSFLETMNHLGIHVNEA